LTLRGAVLLPLLLACADPVEPIRDCATVGGITPICGLANPEDLVAVSRGTWLVISQIRAGDRGGNLIALRPSGKELTLLFPVEGDPLESIAPTPGWGAPDCPGPPDPLRFAPAGIEVGGGPDGKRVLLSTNHGSRHSIELFELTESSPPALDWRGCVPVPGRVLTNDLAALPGGGFVVTNMYPRNWGLGRFWLTLRALLGWNTGYLLEWQPGAGWRQIPNSVASYPNGIEVSPDGETVYFGAFGSSEFVRLKRSDGSERTSIRIPHPDNLTWSRDGRLLVAAHSAPLTQLMGCGSIDEGACGTSFAIGAIDPQTLETALLLDHAGGPPMGGGSVAVQIGDEIFIGSFVGDRIVRSPLPL
jgi:hypothetical protein